jgi:hypothetical protein
LSMTLLVGSYDAFVPWCATRGMDAQINGLATMSVRATNLFTANLLGRDGLNESWRQRAP